MASHLAKSPQVAQVPQPTEDHRGDRHARVHRGEVDCPPCQGRGFSQFVGEDNRQLFAWCDLCEHTGRVELVESSRGFYAVAARVLTTFVQGELDDGAEVVFLGEERPADHRYPTSGPRLGRTT